MNIHSRKYSFIITVFVFTLIMAEDSIVINEINYNSNDSIFNPEDWVEFYNNTSISINMDNWKFYDEADTHIYVFSSIILEPHEYLVLCKDLSLFTELFPDVSNYIGDMGFGLNGASELIRLFDNADILVDSVHYYDDDPWPLVVAGSGPTLELKNPNLDNALPTSWAASESFGTPGSENSSFLSVENSEIPQYFNIESIYPNPFNPETNILYSLDKNAMVTFMIYDINGAKIEELLNEYQITGQHQSIWDASSYPSGVYILKLVVDGYSRFAKLTLTK